MPTSKEILENKPAKYYQFLAECIKVAEYQGTISYEAIGNVISQPAINTRHWAAAVSKDVSEGGHPMLSAVIVGKNNGVPGDGFYQLASNLDHLDQDPESMSEDEKINFWENELKKVYETFSK
ncbi:hypothetical protein [Halorubrum aidingense]|uniref:hypothetical protein n=1 Tax=Halorubrum aidingense TaxID=368623 RepID=UPI001266ED4B|nr:hypothetical protein [Halorubrum aidingense]